MAELYTLYLLTSVSGQDSTTYKLIIIKKYMVVTFFLPRKRTPGTPVEKKKKHLIFLISGGVYVHPSQTWNKHNN